MPEPRPRPARIAEPRRLNGARLRWLTVDESKRLLKARSPIFRKLVQAGLMTGCREFGLLALWVRDFDLHNETPLIADSKNGKPRRHTLLRRSAPS